MKKDHSAYWTPGVMFLILTAVMFFLYQMQIIQKFYDIHNSKYCLVSLGEYRGNKYTSPMQTIGEGTCLVESKWMQVSQHTVRLNPTQKEPIRDWLFINYHDRVNVLVEDPITDTQKGEKHYLVFEQSKYALEGRMTLAVIGGIIEPGEDPEATAKREVNEEMNGVVCATYTFLGRFRTDVNRGMGWVHGFLASDCLFQEIDIKKLHLQDDNVLNQIGAPDTEKQTLRSLSLSELRKKTKDGAFLEVQWSNTVALALLHLDET